MFRNDKPSKIITSADGGVLVGGTSEGAGSDMATYKLKYRDYVEELLDYYERVFKLIKSSLRVLLVGEKEDIGGDYDYITLCYSPLGKLEWAKTYSGTV